MIDTIQNQQNTTLQRIRLIILNNMDLTEFSLKDLLNGNLQKRKKYRSKWERYIFSLQNMICLAGRLYKNKCVIDEVKSNRTALKQYLGRDPDFQDLINEFPMLAEIDIRRDIINHLI